ncbi:MAG: ABC transporter ATP-binding protein [Bacilli bacterium]|nr:ABC transporter ATP-binding protein [Bacilli bacterium]
MDIVTIIKRTKKELIRKIITSVILQGLLLVIPVYWTNSINHATSMEYDIAFKLIIVTLILSLLYYLWSYFNQRAWYNYYNKLYLEYTNLVSSLSVDNVTLGEYTNIINNDIDIIGTFIGNAVTRIIQIIEFLIIYMYFLSIDFYIFLVTLIVSIFMLIVIIYFGSKIEIENKNRKDNLDYKTINIHNIYDILKRKKKVKDNSFINSTIKYLESNAKFNLFVKAMIYLVLGFLELCRYGVILYSIYLVSNLKMEIGTVLLIYSYYGKIITNFEVLGTINAEYQSVKVSINRLNRIKSKGEIYG